MAMSYVWLIEALNDRGEPDGRLYVESETGLVWAEHVMLAKRFQTREEAESWIGKYSLNNAAAVEHGFEEITNCQTRDYL